MSDETHDQVQNVADSTDMSERQPVELAQAETTAPDQEAPTPTLAVDGEPQTTEASAQHQSNSAEKIEASEQDAVDVNSLIDASSDPVDLDESSRPLDQTQVTIGEADFSGLLPHEILEIVRPSPKEVAIKELFGKKGIRFLFNLDDARILIFDVDVVIVFPDDAKIVLPELALRLVTTEEMMISFNDGQIENQEFLSRVGDISVGTDIPVLNLSPGDGQGTDEQDTEGMLKAIQRAAPRNVEAPRSTTLPIEEESGSERELTVEEPSFGQSSTTFSTSTPVNTNAGGSSDGGSGGVAGTINTGNSSNDTLVGTDNNDTLNGLGGDDTLTGDSGDDLLNGGSGSDIAVYAGDASEFSVDASGATLTVVDDQPGLNGDEGTDTLTGIETLRFNGVDYDVASFVSAGTAGSDTVVGASGDDTLDGSAGADVVFGGRGNDTLDGGSEADAVFGGSGDDTIAGGAGGDVLSGGTGNDTLSYATDTAGVSVNLATDTVSGGDAAGDTISGFENVTGGSGGDILTGTATDNTLRGNGGNDTLSAGAGSDILYGDAGDDTLDGGSGSDIAVYAGDASEFSVDASGATLTVVDDQPGLNGDEGTDTLTGIETLRFNGVDYDVASFVSAGTAGSDTVVGASGDDTLDGSAGADVVFGGRGNDTLDGGSDADAVFGGSGDDTIAGGAGGDVLSGGTGNDTLSYVTDTAGVSVNLATDTVSGGDAAGDTISGFENVTGGSGGDILTGTATDNTLRGNGGNDTLSAGAGSDILYGDAGDDTLDGGSGADLFFGGADTDTVTYASAASGITLDLSNLANNTGDAAGDTYSQVEVFVGSSFADVMTGDAGANILLGSGGADIITGNAGDDTLDGGSEDDTLTGGSGDDTIAGGSGSDIAVYAGDASEFSVDASGATLTVVDDQPGLNGDEGTDTLTGIETLRFNGVDYDVASFVSAGTAGSDTVVGASGDDTLDGSAGADVVFGGRGNDTLDGGSEADAVFGGSGDDTIAGGAGGDVLSGGTGNDTLSYATDTAGVSVNLATDTVSGGDAAGDTISGFENVTGGSGGDILTGTATDNTLRGNGGNDTLSAGAGSDILYGDAGDDTLDGGSGSDIAVYAGDASEFSVDASGATLTVVDDQPGLNGDEGTDTLTGIETLRFNGVDYDVASFVSAGTAGSDTVVGASGDDTLDGSAGADVVFGGRGNDTLDGGSDADAVFGGSGDDTIAGGSGGDVLSGGTGNDTLSYVTDTAGVSVNLATDTVSGGDAAGDTISGFENVTGGSGGDILTGTATDNTLRGNGGNDTLEGGAGTDVAVYSGNVADYTVTLVSGDTYTITDNRGGSPDGTDTVTGVENARFADGTFSVVDLASGIINGDNNDNVLTGTPNDDTINGLGGDDTLTGGSGDDTIAGGSGSDIAVYAGDASEFSVDASGATLTVVDDQPGLNGDEGTDTLTGIETLRFNGVDYDVASFVSAGTAGSDTVVGASGDDTLDGSAGADVVFGGRGNDTLDGGSDADAVFGGSGDDTIAGGSGGDVLSGGTGNDTLSYVTDTAGVSVNLATDTVSGGDAAGDTISGFENVTGGSGGDILTGTATDNTLRGNGGNDTLSAGAGSDILYGDAGDDTLDGGAGADLFFGGSDTDTVTYASAASGITLDLSNLGNNTGDAAGDTYSQVEVFVGSSFADVMTGDAGANILLGSGGADIITGNAGDDTLEGGTENDTLTGGSGNDTIAGGSGSDIAVYAGDASEFSVDASGATLTVVDDQPGLNGDEGTDTLTGIETLRFNGVDYDVASFVSAGTAGSDTVVGASGDDTLDGSAGADVVFGGRGNDTLDGGSDADAVFGGSGDDTIAGGSGGDVLSGGTGNDTLSYATDTAGVSVNLATDTVSGGDAAGDTISGFENVTGGSGGDILTGTATDNTLRGNGGNDTLSAGAGSDILYGDAGDDTLDGGSGSDIAVYAGDASEFSVDASGATLTVVDDQPGLNGDEGTDTLTGIETLRFNGVDYDVASFVSAGTAGSDTVVGASGDDTLDGSAGADVVFGGRGNDTLDGGSDADAVFGGSGDDTIAGGSGGDVLSGGTGNDTLSYVTDTAGVSVNLATDTVSGGDAAGDTISGFENVTGGSGGDILTGTATDNTLRGNGGNDTLSAGAGSDILYGDAGDDTLDGGSGADLFFGGADTDTVTYASAASGITLDLSNLANNTGDAAGDTYSQVEVFVGSSFADVMTGDAGANILLGSGGADIITGNAGDDTLEGGTENDTLTGGSGNDTIAGGSGSDIAVYAGDASEFSVDASGATLTVVDDQPGLNGDEGTDTLTGIETLRFNGVDYDVASFVSAGTAGSDTVVGASGDDTLDGSAGADVVFGGRGNDTLDGGSEADAVFGGSGDDTIAGGAGGDVLSGGTGNDTLSYATDTAGVSVNLATDTVSGGDAAGDTISGFENVTGGSGGDILTGTATDNTLRGNGGNDTLSAGAGSDILYGDAGDDTLDGGSGSDIAVYAGDASEFSVDASGATLTVVDDQPGLNGDEGTDTLTGIETLRFNGVDYDVASFVSAGTAGSDTVVGASGDDTLDGSAGADVVFGGRGNDTLDGGSDADAVFGGSGDDTIAGGAGGDVLSGGTGNDTLSYATDTAGVSVNLATDTVSGGDAAGDTISGFENVTGGSGGDILTGTATDNTLRGNGGNDTLSAGAGSDILYGDAGDDTLDGGSGSDIAVYAGDASEFSVDASGATLTVVDDQPGLNGDEGTDTLTGIETLRFNGVDYDVASFVSAGTAGSDTVVGASGDDTLDGSAGADVVFGGRGNDTLDGGSDADAVFGGSGDDTIAGGSGGDVLSGGTGNDTLSYATDTAGVSVNLATDTVSGGDAAGDTISGFENVTGGSGGDILTGTATDNTLRGNGGNDTLSAGAGSDILYGDAGDDTLDGGSGSDIAVYAGDASEFSVDASGATLTVMDDQPGLNGDEGTDTLTGIETLRFNGVDYDVASFVSAGTAGSDTVVGASGDDTLDGSAGADVVFGGRGNDTLDGGSDADAVFGGSGDDTIAGGSGGDVLSGGTGNDTLSYVTDTAGVSVNLATDTVSGGDAAGDTISGFENVTGGSGGDILTGTATDNTLRGNGGNDTLSAGAGSDILYGDAGDDTLDGGSGADLFFGGADTDTVTYASAASGITLDLSNLANNTGDAAGDTYSQVEVFVGSSFADVMTGDAGANILLGSGGADIITGNAGDDTLEGGTENDTLTGGSGNDTIAGGSGSDIAVYAGDASEFSVDASGATLTVVDDQPGLNGDEGTDTLTGIETLRFNGVDYDVASFVSAGTAGSDTVVGASGDDTLDGSAGADVVFGGRGNDTLDGGSDADAVFGGSGDDTIAGGSGGDVLSGGTGSDIAVYAGDASEFSVYASGATLTVVDDQPGLNGDEGTDTLTGIETLRFNGVDYDVASFVSAGTAGADTVVGTSGMDLISGGAGNDVMFGGAGVDLIQGDGDNDILFGGSGLDELRGGTGTDALYGGIDNDLLGGGLGNDTLSGGDGTDIADFDGDASEFSVDASGATLTVVDDQPGLNGDEGTDTLTGIETLRFNGVDYDVASFVSAGTAGADTVVGASGDDTLDGSAGADVVFGGRGNDTLDGGSDADAVFGGSGDDTIAGGSGGDVLSGGTGNDTLSYVTDTAGVSVNLATDTVSGGDAAGDTISGFENVTGGSGGDILTGTATDNTLRGNGGIDTLYGGAGDDTIQGGDGGDAILGGAGADALDGGSGTDIAYYQDSTAGVTIDLGAGTGSGGYAQGDTLTDIEGIYGSNYDDTLTGSNANNFLSGMTGDDTITGGVGNDAIDGGSGTDTAVYSGNRVDYTITESAGTYTIIDGRSGSPDGTDSVTNVENFQFADGTVAVANILNVAPTDILVDKNHGISLNIDGGNNAYLSATDAGNIVGGLSAITIEVEFSSSNVDGTDMMLFSYHSGGAGDEIEIGINNDGMGNTLYLEIAGELIGNIAGYDASQLLDGGNHQVSLTWDNTAGDWGLFVDGVLLADGAGVAVGQTIESGGQIVLGQEQDSLGGGFDPAQNFDGTYYDVRIFNDVRTNQEILDNVFGEVANTEPGLVANWRMDDLSGGVSTDEVSGNNLTVGNVVGPGWVSSTPSFSSVVSEGAPSGTVIATLSTVDADAGDSHSYQIISDPTGALEIVGNEIRVKAGASLDYEAGDTDNPIALQFSEEVLAQAASGENVVISGIPVGSILSAGTDNGNGSWTVPGGQASGLMLTPPAGYYSEIALTVVAGVSENALTAEFSSGTDGFAFNDTAGTYSTPSTASDLGMILGGVDDNTITNMEASWSRGFTVSEAGLATLTFDYRMILSSEYEANEYGEIQVKIDGNLVTFGANQYVIRVAGDGNGGSPDDTGWQTVSVDLGTLAAGAHTIELIGFNNQKTFNDETVEIRFDNIGVDVGEGVTDTFTVEPIATSDVVVQTTDSAGNTWAETITIELSNAAEIVSGTSGNDTLNGTNNADIIIGGSGNDIIDGGNGTDTAIFSGRAPDFSVDASGGTITVVDNNAADGDEGTDTLTGIETLRFLDGSYNVSGFVTAGTSASETIIGSSAGNSLDAGQGNDIVFGGRGNDVLDGELGDDIVFGGSGDDRLILEFGVDRLHGGSGSDILDIISNSDVTADLQAGTVSGTGIGGSTVSGFETVWGGSGNDTLLGTSGADTLYGWLGADDLQGRDGADILDGEDGNDTLTGGAGDDTLDGAGGSDIAVFAGDAGDYTVQASGGTITVIDNNTADGDEGTDTLTSIETLRFNGVDYDVSGFMTAGTSSSETIIGTSGDDTLEGDGGNDLIFGGSGADTLIGDVLNPQNGLLNLNNSGQTNQYGRVVNFSGFPSTQITVEVTVQAQGAPNGFDVLWSYETIGGGNEFTAYREGNSTDFTIYVDGTSAVISSAIDVFDGQKHTVSATWDASTGEYRFYVDGALQSTTTINQGTWLASGGSFIVGQEQDSVGGGFSLSQRFNGTIDEVRVFNDIRTDQEIADNWDMQLSDPANEQGLVSNWQMSEDAGGYVADSAGSNNLTLYNGANITTEPTSSPSGDDILLGGSGNDTIYAGRGNDTVFGGFGDDTIEGGDRDPTPDEIIVSHAPVGYWRFGESNGSVAVDVTGTSNGTYSNNGVTLGVSGPNSNVSDTAVDFDGTSGFVTIAHDPAFELAQGTVEFWFNADTLSQKGYMFVKQTGGGDRLFFLLENGDLKANLGGSNFAHTLSGANVWQHLAFTWDGVDMKLYIDGVNVAQKSTDKNTVGNMDDLFIGSDSGTGDFFNGTIDELAIYNSSLSAGVIGELYDTGLNGGVITTSKMYGDDGNDAINGGSKDDIISGGAGNDTIDGGAGTDITVFAGDAGDFSVDASGGTITVVDNNASDGDEGTDTLTSIETLRFNGVDYDVSAFVTSGTSGDDVIIGTSGDDGSIGAGLGNDIVFGGRGNDVIVGGGGIDTLFGGTGDDRIDPGGGDDAVFGGAGSDTIRHGGGLSHTVNLSTGQSTTSNGTNTLDSIENVDLSGVTASSSITGSDVANVLTGGSAADTIEGGGGNDTIDGQGGTDIAIFAGVAGDYSVDGSGGTITVVDDNPGDGDEGTDTLTSIETLRFAGVDYDVSSFIQVDGGSGNDMIIGTSGVDSILNGNDGNDIIFGGRGNDFLDGDGGDDVLFGGEGNDTLRGDQGTNTMYGGAGDDEFQVGTDTDNVFGGSGTDTLSNTGANDQITVTFSGNGAGTFLETDGDSGTFDSIEVVETGSSNDTIDASADSLGVTIDAGAGADTVTGGSGNDTFIIDTSDLSIDGGTGTDTVRFEDSTGAIGEADLDGILANVEILDFTNIGNNANLSLNLSQIQGMTDAGNQMTVDIDGGDTVIGVDEAGGDGISMTSDTVGNTTTYTWTNDTTTNVEAELIVNVA